MHKEKNSDRQIKQELQRSKDYRAAPLHHITKANKQNETPAAHVKEEERIYEQMNSEEFIV